MKKSHDIENSQLLQGYTLLGDITDKVQLYKDPNDHYIVVKNIFYNKKITKDNCNYFNKEVEFLKKIQDQNLYFVHLIANSSPPTQNVPGIFLTEYEQGGSLMHQINVQKKIAKDKEVNNYTIQEYYSSNLPFKRDIIPHCTSSSVRFPVIDFMFNPPTMMINIYGIAQAIKKLHDLQIIHRNIKPENILVDKNCCPRLSDSGCARIIYQTQQKSSIKETEPYIAPEIIRNNECTVKVDIFSLGATMIMILKGKLEIKYKDQEINAYTQEEFDQIKLLGLLQNNEKYIIPKEVNYTLDGVSKNDKVPDALQKLIDKCLSFKPQDRPNIDQVIDVLKEQSIIVFGGDKYQEYISNNQYQ